MRKDNLKTVSTELTGGAGFTFEDRAVAYYLTALVCEKGSSGGTGIVNKVSVQQSANGFPLDDIVIEFGQDADTRTTSLQVKTKVSISAAISNADFREIVTNSLATMKSENFVLHRDRFGFVCREVSNNKFRELKKIIDWANASATASDFRTRFQPSKNASQAVIKVRNDVKDILGKISSEDEWNFYRHFVALRFFELEDTGSQFAEQARSVKEFLQPENGNANAIVKWLWTEARSGAGLAATWTRQSLLKRLRQDWVVLPASSLSQDLVVLKTLVDASILEIHDAVGDLVIPRDSLIESIIQKSSQSRFVNISGLPGTGKSVVLRKIAEANSKNEPILFIKSDRLRGARTWVEFASANGIINPLKKLLLEIEALGTPILFVDGVDRLSIQERGVVLDLLHQIASDASFTNWKIITTSRDQNLEAFRTWIPRTYQDSNTFSNVGVSAFSKEECEQIAKRYPSLRGMLFGGKSVREITRRPFFVNTLYKLSQTTEFETPVNENALVDLWWTLGGYNVADLSARIPRQRALIDLVKQSVLSSGKNIKAEDLAAQTVAELAELINDGVVREVRSGSVYSFSHDIFFEWTLLKRLDEMESAWLDAIVAAGEPPLLGRVVSLLSAAKYIDEDAWAESLEMLETSSHRKQWTRAWLLAPLTNANFLEKASIFDAAVLGNDTRLRHLLVWFQAECTIPNPNFASHKDIESDFRKQRLADFYSWPSDLSLWGRTLDWVSTNIEAIEKKFPLETIEVFKIWQNLLSDYPNDRSQIMSDTLMRWYRLLIQESGDDTARTFEISGKSKSALFEEIRKFIFLAADSNKSFAIEILQSLQNEDTTWRSERDIFKEVVSFSPRLVSAIPKDVIEFFNSHILEELPKPKLERRAAEHEEQIKRRKELLKKPEEERTRLDEIAIHSPSLFTSQGIDEFELNELSMDRCSVEFTPQSPKREPFASLFALQPKHALRFAKGLANHAITAWRQIHEIESRSRPTPVPLTLQFPWGDETFHGDSRTYQWFINGVAPAALGCALQELHHWAHERADAGDDIDDILKDILSDADCFAFVGVAVSLIIEHRHYSEISLPILKSFKVWDADFKRQVSFSPSTISLMGVDLRHGLTEEQKSALDDIEKRALISLSVKDLALEIMVATDDDFRSEFEGHVKSFPENIEVEFLEDRDPPYFPELERKAKAWREFVNRENFSLHKTEDDQSKAFIQYNPPPSSDVEEAKRREEAHSYLTLVNVFTWAMGCLQAHELDNKYELRDVVKHLRENESQVDLSRVAEPEGALPQSAFICTALLCIRHSQDKALLKWANRIIDTVLTIKPRVSESLSIPNNQHPLSYAAYALSARIKNGTKVKASFQSLLRIMAHPRREVSASAFHVMISKFESYPQQAWCALSLASDLMRYNRREFYGENDVTADKNTSLRKKALQKALANLKKGKSVKLSSPPMTWENLKPRKTPFENHTEWRHPMVSFDWSVAKAYFDDVTFQHILASDEYREPFIHWLSELNDWVVSFCNPPFEKNRYRSKSYKLNGWSSTLTRHIAKLVEFIEPDTLFEQFITPYINFESEDAFDVLNDFTNILMCNQVYDADTIHDDAVYLLKLSLEAFCAHPDIAKPYRRNDTIRGFPKHNIVETFLLISVKDAPKAKRFANGNWEDLPLIEKLPNQLIQNLGSNPFVLSQYLTLCERAQAFVNPHDFADNILHAIRSEEVLVPEWKRQLLFTRISIIIQVISEREDPLEPCLALKLLEILDEFVDLGNRRATALLQSQGFRSIRISPSKQTAA